MIWFIGYLLFGSLIFLGLGIWAASTKRETASDTFLLSITNLLLLLIWPLALPFMLKEMFSESPREPSAHAAKRQHDPMIGALGLASTDLRPSGTITIESGKFDAVSISGMIAKGATVEVVDRDGIQVTVKASEPQG